VEPQKNSFIRNDNSPNTKALDDKLLHLQIEKQGIEMQLDKLPEAPKQIA
jgi:hypothetical protein